MLWNNSQKIIRKKNKTSPRRKSMTPCPFSSCRVIRILYLATLRLCDSKSPDISALRRRRNE